MAPPTGGVSSRRLLRPLLVGLLALHQCRHHLSQRTLRGRRSVRTETTTLRRRSRAVAPTSGHARTTTERELSGCIPSSVLRSDHVNMDALFARLLPLHGPPAVVAEQSARGLPVAPPGGDAQAARPSRHAVRPDDARIPLGAAEAGVRGVQDEASLLPHSLGAVGRAASRPLRRPPPRPGPRHQHLRRPARLRRETVPATRRGR